jgi:hypothetical protein
VFITAEIQCCYTAYSTTNAHVRNQAAFLLSRSRFKTTKNIWSKLYWSEIHLHLVCHVALLEDHPSQSSLLRIPLQFQGKLFVLFLHRYLLTYSTQQSPSWAANQSLQLVTKFPAFLRNLKVLYLTHKCPPPVPFLSQLHPAPTTPSNFWFLHRYVQKLKLKSDLKWKQNFIETHRIILKIRHHDRQRWAQNHERMLSVACTKRKTVSTVIDAVYVIKINRRFGAKCFLQFGCRTDYIAAHSLWQHLQFLQRSRRALNRRTRTKNIVASFIQIGTVARHEIRTVT